MNKSAQLIVAFTAGAAAGLLAGILFAPAKGADTRKKIAETGKEVNNAVTEMLGKCKREKVNAEES